MDKEGRTRMDSETVKEGCVQVIMVHKWGGETLVLEKGNNGVVNADCQDHPGH